MDLLQPLVTESEIQDRVGSGVDCPVPARAQTRSDREAHNVLGGPCTWAWQWLCLQGV